MEFGNLIIKNKKIMIDTIGEKKIKQLNRQQPIPNPLIKKIQDKILTKTEQDLIDYYQPMIHNGKEYEMLMSQTIHLELLLKRLIALKINQEENKFNDSNLNTLIEVSFLLELISKEQAEKYIFLKNVRNKYAHELVFHSGKTQFDIMKNFGDGIVAIIEVQNKIKQMGGES